MSAAQAPWPTIFERHPSLGGALAEAQRRQWERYPMPALCAFLARIETRFPGMQIEVLRPISNYYDSSGDMSAISFLWLPERILEARLIEPSAIPVAPKRVVYSYRSAIGGQSGPEMVHVHRAAHGWVRVGTRVSDTMPLEHPFAFFRPAAVRGAPTRPALRLVVDNTREVMP